MIGNFGAGHAHGQAGKSQAGKSQAGQSEERQSWWRRVALGCLIAAGSVSPAVPSLSGQTADVSQTALQAQVSSMQTRLETAQRQIDEDHAELLALRHQIEALTHLPATPSGEAAAPASAAAADLQQAVVEMQERQAMNQAAIEVHEQEKVESASKYSVKLHGLVLFNASVNRGAADQPTSPLIAIAATKATTVDTNDGSTAANGSLTATGRQTLLGLAATGPTLWGARTYANVEMDFAGVGSSGDYAGEGNLFRLRTASMELAWPKTIARVGISPLILTPGYATSYFSIAEPAMSWSGSLWGWLPQISVEHDLDLSTDKRLTFEAALADIPDAGTNTAGLGFVSAAERNRFPGSEVRAAWEGKGRRPAAFGVGGYWSPHSYGASAAGPGGSFNAWAGTADWQISLPARLQVSGALYDGAALGGLSAGAFKDSIFAYGQGGFTSSAKLTALKDAGGWGQLKFKPIEPLEFNLAFGLDDANSLQLRRTELGGADPFTGLARNQTAFGNIIFRPRSTLLLSGEYRRIRSWQITGRGNDFSFFGLAVGYAF